MEEKVEELQNENIKLKDKIKDNIDILSKTEKVIKQLKDRNKQIEDEKNDLIKQIQVDLEDVKRENSKLLIKIKGLEEALNTKDDIIKRKEEELIEAKGKVEAVLISKEPGSQKVPLTDSKINAALIEDLQSDLSKKKSQIANYQKKIEDLEGKINDLQKENELLNNKLKEEVASPSIDLKKTTMEKEISSKPAQGVDSSSKTLEILCQDLQSDLNKYKRIVKKLKEENAKLKSTGGEPSLKIEAEEIKRLKEENASLKKQILKLEKSTVKTSKGKEKIDDSDLKIKELQEQIIEKDQLILELKAAKSAGTSGPMSELIEDLQKQINKLKNAIKEKNKIIAELKKK